MRYKSKVLARFPDARLEALDRWDDGSPRYQRVVAGPEWNGTILDIHDGAGQQGAAAAWRSAYYWCVRNPRPAGHLQPLAPGELLRIVRGEAV